MYKGKEKLIQNSRQSLSAYAQATRDLVAIAKFLVFIHLYSPYMVAYGFALP